ncbi:MAG: HD domain-containing protein [Prevotella sp.]|nr:HD domain-containing protein [Prevotella sp.]
MTQGQIHTLAATLHLGQTDKGGKPYIDHPVRVAARCSDPQAKLVALLHDVIEDTTATAEYLLRQGVPGEVVEVVEVLTRRSDESYDDYIHRVARHPLAKVVKLADLEDNMDIRRLPTLTDADLRRLQTYHRAWRYLNEKK